MKTQTTVYLVLVLLLSLVCQAVAEQSPTELYKTFRQAEAKSRDIRSLAPFYCAEKVKAMEEMSPADEQKYLQIWKMTNIHAVRVTDEQIKGQKATLTAQGKMNSFSGAIVPTWGTIELVKENGQWKLYKENWSDKKP